MDSKVSPGEKFEFVTGEFLYPWSGAFFYPQTKIQYFNFYYSLFYILYIFNNPARLILKYNSGEILIVIFGFLEFSQTEK